MKKIASYLIIFFLIFVFKSATAQVYGWGEVGASSDSIFKTGPIIAMTTDAQNNIYASGEFPDSAGNYYVAKWNGTNWSKLGTGINSLNANSWILYMVNDNAGNIYVSGFFKNSASQYYIAKWNGQTWSAINVTVSGYTYGGYNIAVDNAGNLYTSVYMNNAAPSFEVVKWNGQSWSLLGIGSALLNANNTIHAIASDAAGNIYVGGEFTDSLNTIIGNLYVAKWNGQTWSSLTSNSSYLNNASKSYGITHILPDATGNIYIHCYPSIFKWNGQSWQILDSTYLCEGVYYKSICADASNNVYSLDAYSRNCSKWNGTMWDNLGGKNKATSLQANSPMNCILSDNSGNIYTAGYFRNFKNSYYVAKYGIQNCISYFTVDYDTALNTFNVYADTAITAHMAVSYHWDFGDGSSSNLQFPTHTYLVDTVYNVCLTIHATNGDSCTYCHIIGKDYQGNIIKSAGYNLNVKGQSNIGVNEIKNEKAELMIYPNPASQSIVISHQLLVNTIKVTNLLGQQQNVIVEKLTIENYLLNTENLNPGIYFIKATDENGKNYNAKFVKE
jgi:hypothetical protein